MPENGHSRVLDVFEELCKNKPSRFYHYVRKNNAEHSLKVYGDISCGHTSRQNDPCEICVGAMEFLKFCNRVNALPQKHISALRDLLRYDFLDPKFKGLDMMAKFTPTMPYIFCVTSNDESPYQWRNYTDKKDGGYCFCFDSNKFNQALRSRRRGEVNVALIFSPCLYIGVDDKIIDRLFLAMLTDYKCEFEQYSRCKDPLSLPEIVQFLQSRILTIAPLIKHGKWAHEKEWRLILVPGNTECNNPYRPSGLSETLYCSHPIDLMTSIKMSPHGDVDDLRKYAERININTNELLEKSAVDKSVVEHYIRLPDDKLDAKYEEYVLMQPVGTAVCSQEEFLSSKST